MTATLYYASPISPDTQAAISVRQHSRGLPTQPIDSAGIASESGLAAAKAPFWNLSNSDVSCFLSLSFSLRRSVALKRKEIGRLYKREREREKERR